MEAKRNVKIENAAHDYADARDERMRLGEEEQRRHTKLVAILKAEGIREYRHRTGDEVITVKLTVKDPEEKAKVRIAPADEEPESSVESSVEQAVELEVQGGEGAAE